MSFSLDNKGRDRMREVRRRKRERDRRGREGVKFDESQVGAVVIIRAFRHCNPGLILSSDVR